MAQEQKEEVIRVCVTGAAGQIGYSILPLFASGAVFGENKRIILQLLEITPVLKSLNGVHMELDDCAYPLLDQVICTDKADVAFKDVDYAVLVGGFPRKPGMQRKDLMEKNAPIFKSMGEAIDKFAKKTVRVLVVANPANTNCLICATNAPSIPKKNFCALTRLDFNRARSQIAIKLGVKCQEVKNVVIWGNHSSTMVPDISAATACGKPIKDKVDAKFIKESWIPTVQERGKAIMEARGFSSALSAANATKDCLRDWVLGTPPNETVAMSVYSDGSYGIEKGLFFSFPCTAKNGQYKIVTDYKVSDEIKALMKNSEKELLAEKAEAGLK